MIYLKVKVCLWVANATMTNVYGVCQVQFPHGTHTGQNSHIHVALINPIFQGHQDLNTKKQKLDLKSWFSIIKAIF